MKIENFKLKIISPILYLVIVSCFLMFAPSAQAGTIIKAPAYLGLNQGLVGCWTFDGLYTKAPDCSGNNNTGTLTNGPTKVQGKVGQALSFDDVDDYVNMGDLFYRDIFSVCAWVKPDQEDATQVTIVAKRNNSANPPVALSNEWSLVYDTFTKFEFFSWDSGGVVALNIQSAAAPVLNKWSHVCSVQNGNGQTGYIYVNGVESGSATQTSAMINSASSIQVGARTNGNDSRYIHGSIDEVRIYRRALSATEIERLYLISLGSKGNRSIATDVGGVLSKGLVGCWSFDGIYTKAPDCSGNNNTGTLTNGPRKVQGKVGQALSFDGVNDSVEGLANFPLPVTINAIFKYSIYGDHQVIFSNNSIANNGYRLKINTSNQVSFTFGAVADYDFTNLTVTEGIWYHLALTVTGNGGTVTAYLTPFGGATSSQALSVGTMAGSLTHFQIGTTIGLGDFFKGTIDEVRVYNRVLSVEEIRRLYNQTQSKFNSPQTDSLTYRLVGCWTFDGLYTKAPDCSGNNNTGTLTNGPTKVQGKVGQALSFDGANDYIELGTPSTLSILGEVSISAWVKASAFAGTNPPIVSATDSSANFKEYDLDVANATSKVRMGWNSAAIVTGNTALDLNRWYHIVGVRSGSSGNWTARIYVNGVLDNSATTATDPSAASSWGPHIGSNGTADGAGDRFWTGLIDEVRIYNRALSAGEVQKLYNMGR